MRRVWALTAEIVSSTTPIALTAELDPTRVPLTYGRPAVNWRIVGRGGTPPYAFSLIAGSMPPGLALASDGTISGTPTAVGQRSIYVQMQDSSGSPQATVRVFGLGVASNLSYTPQTIPPGEIGVPFSYTVRVTGAVGALTFSAPAGTLPAGLSISAAGVISGTPAAPDGITATTIHVVDSSGAPLDIPIVITIAPALTAVLPSPQTELFNGSTVQFDLTPWFTGGVGPYAAKELGGLAGYGLSVQSSKAGRWYIVGTLRMNDWDEDIPPPGSTAGVTITDALGAHVDVAIGLVLRNPVNSLGTQLNGIDVGPRTATKVNLVGGFARGATTAPDQTMTTFDIGMTLPASSVAGRVTGTGDPVAITATVNTVLGFPAFGSLGFGKVAPAMLASTAAASSARVYGGAGDWVTSVAGTWGATAFLVAGTQVVGARQTGWTAPTGTAFTAAWNANAINLLTFSNPPTQAECIALRNACYDVARRVYSLETALRTHGLIGT